jgi:hypothetical protein
MCVLYDPHLITHQSNIGVRWRKVTVTICLEGLADMAAFYWLTSMVENNP